MAKEDPKEPKSLTPESLYIFKIKNKKKCGDVIRQRGLG